MNRFQIEAFFRQFPFIMTDEALRNAIGEFEEVEEVSVSRISPEFLETRPWYRASTGSLVDIHDNEWIYLMSKDNEILVQVEQSWDVVHNEAHRDNEFEEHETIGESLLRLENPDKVFCAVKIHTGYRVLNHCSVGGCAITVYRAPKGFTLKGWVDEQLKRAKTRLEATIAEIDAET